ncbi:MAG: hypothetical protein IH627_12390 [Rubrivivax sp.]|nr:hypothetical protein [Rubrivivax sp.]
MTGRLTLFKSPDLLCKQWELDAAGVPIKTAAAQLWRGDYRVQEFSSAADLAAILNDVTTRQAVSASLPLDGSVTGVITTAANEGRDGAKSRSKRNFGLQPGPGLLFIDHDAPSAEGGMTREDLWAKLCEFIPALRQCGVVWRPSGSSHIFHIFHGEKDLTSLRGQHLFVLLQDASDGPRVLKYLEARSWLDGLGTVKVSAAGSLLLRCPIDTAVRDPARLIFSGGAECAPPLEQRRGPPIVLSEGGFLDSRRDVPELTAEQQGRYQALVESAKTAAMVEALPKRAEHRSKVIAKRLPELMKQGATAGEAEARIGQMVDAMYSGLLLADAELTLVHDNGQHEVVTVDQVLSQRDRYHETKVLDPLNPGHRGGAADGMLFLRGTSPIVYSFDDGGQVYRLRAARRRVVVQKGSRSEVVTALADVVADLDRAFITDAGMVLVQDGRRIALSPERLMNLVGLEVQLVTIGAKGAELPTDLPMETAKLVLTELVTRGARHAA